MYNIVVKTTNGDYRCSADSKYEVSQICTALNEVKPDCFVTIFDEVLTRAGDVIVIYVEGEKEESK